MIIPPTRNRIYLPTMEVILKVISRNVCRPRVPIGAVPNGWYLRGRVLALRI